MTAACYVVLEGLEGCGKSTQAALLAADLGARLTRETGGTETGAAIRALLADPANTHLSPRTEALLAAADRAQHLAEVVVPTLASGRHVVSDRSAWSSLAYQAYGRQLPVDDVRRLNDWAIGGRWPDLAVYLLVPPPVLAERMADRELDRFEREDGAFFARVADGYAEMADADPAHWVVVDGSATTEQVAVAVRAAVRERLGL
jgi:dTMP kinase